MAGRITRGKGHEDFIAAAKIISNQRQDLIFLIVGGYVVIDKEYELGLRKCVEKMDLRVKFSLPGGGTI